ncbi:MULTISPECIES: response regulator transcription factor [Brevibacillus]|uniref:Two component transcriptional regulator, winged helix family protein n=1 Tax=Brevibacillus borstelensis AK1 TaxID=1300222 RepID=M8DW68_9BACL|nr:response regulator transcription factor [Brevibacillus borstelensis]EMT51246.1 Two component transcriptional regulator, winged helix family protein [Brevibacillus borstelensis AK1]KKX57166.1 regulator [Brevibacillus borstelensis cifa_chp40]MBE5397327.1 response regulator transcription factor [Brevibacillus borstelensis]MCC0567136.1 response regulator transcription factor [Brevibacillus borstelensis]MCM3472575.1 response regulator transcription factor [Brevibacillus borstelensis]
MHILVAEDDLMLGQLIAHLLKKKGGYQVEWLTTGDDVCEYALKSHYDVLILDWMLPGEEGVSICSRLRKEGYSGAIIMLTAKDALEDKINGLDAGADDYLIKPFEIDELLARIRAVSRRNFAPIQEQLVELQNIRVNLTQRTVFDGETEVYLTPREFQLLDLLIRNKGQVLSRELIYDRIWGYEADVSLKTIDATVKLLRKKLNWNSEKDYIQSIRGVGYKLDI